MPRAPLITAELVEEVRRRRATGEAWKAILGDLRRRGLPHGRTKLSVLLADVRERLDAGQHDGERRTP